MSPDLKWLVWSVGLSLVMMLAASAARSKIWTAPGAALAFGNRESMPECSAIAGRGQRATDNMLVGLVYFAALLLAAHVADPATAGKAGGAVARGAELFFWARLAYAFLYWLGIAYLRTAAWFASVVGLAMIASVLV